MKNLIDTLKKEKFLKYGIVTVLSFFLLTLIQNIWTQFASDDWCYMFIYDHMGYPTETTARVKNIFDVIISMINHWKICNGRVVAHGLLQLVLSTSYPAFHKVIFNIVNSLMYTTLGIVIYRHASYKKGNSLLLLIGIYAMMWFFLPQYGATVLWPSGAAGYLWCSVIILAYLLPYRMYAANSENVMKDSVKNAVIMGILGLFAGCTNENSGGALALMCILFVLLFKLSGIKIPKWSLTGIAGTIIGAVVLLTAPGNYRISSKADLPELLNRLKNVIEISGKIFFGLLLIMCALLLFSWILNLRKRPNHGKSYTDRLLVVIYVIGAAASVGVLMFAAMRPERTWFIGVCLIISAIGYIYEGIDFSDLPKRFIPICCIIVTVICAVSYCVELGAIHDTYIITKEQERTISEAAKNGQKTVSIEIAPRSECKHDALCKDYGISHFQFKSDDWVNSWAARYYGIDSISGRE